MESRTGQVYPIQLSDTVIVKAGSRQENLDNSSVANFAAHAARSGTSKYSKDKIEEIIESISGELNINVSREITSFNLTCDPSGVSQAIDSSVEGGSGQSRTAHSQVAKQLLVNSEAMALQGLSGSWDDVQDGIGFHHRLTSSSSRGVSAGGTEPVH